MTVKIENQNYVIVDSTEWTLIEGVKRKFHLVKKPKGTKLFTAIEFASGSWCLNTYSA